MLYATPEGVNRRGGVSPPNGQNKKRHAVGRTDVSAPTDKDKPNTANGQELCYVNCSTDKKPYMQVRTGCYPQPSGS